MSFEVVGVLHKKYDTENKTETFQAREFVIKTDGQYPQFVKFQLVQDRCQALDPFNEDESIKVFFDLRGREWNGKYFTNLNAWKIERAGASNAAAPAPASNAAALPTEEPPFNNTAKVDESLMNQDMDDLPF